MVRIRSAALALAIISLAAVARGQVVWNGGADDNFSNAANWGGGVSPANDGSEIVDFPAGNALLNLDVAADFSGLELQQLANVTVIGPNALTIGSSGINLSYDGTDFTSALNINVPVTLGADQTWAIQNAGGTLTVSGAISGFHAIQLVGNGSVNSFTFNSGSSTFGANTVTLGLSITGAGSYLTAGTSSTGTGDNPTSGPFGVGIVQLGDGTTLNVATGSPIKIDNSLSIGTGTANGTVGIGGTLGFANPGQTLLTFTGTTSLRDDDLEIDIGSNSTVTFQGALTGYTGGVCLDFGNPGSVNSLAVITGNISNVARFDLEDSVSVIFAGTAANQVAPLEDIGTGGEGTTYVGMGTSYADAASFAALTGKLNGPMSGTLGFDTTSGSSTTVFNNYPIDISGATFQGSNFVGLGSATSAIIGPNAVILPPGNGTASGGVTYPFGGGGGTLTVQSPIADGTVTTGGPVPGGSNVVLSAGNAPLTLILSGSLSYSGGTTVDGGALIFDTPPDPLANIQLGYGSTGTGYIGSTVNSDFIDANPVGGGNVQDFLNRIQVNSGATDVVVGFDYLTGGVRTITSPIDMSSLPSNVFLGTATQVIYQGVINPAGTTYQFAGVKGGQVTVSSALTGGNSVVVGLPDPIESYNSTDKFVTISAVTLDGTFGGGSNTYTGGTTLNSGYLYVTNSNSLGTGALTIPDPDNDRAGWVASLNAINTPVNLPNPIAVASNGIALNFGSTETLTLSGQITNSSSAGQLGVFGPVDISGTNNFYNGGTVLGQGGYLFVGTGNALGYGALSVQPTSGPAPTLAPDGAFSEVSNAIDLQGSVLQLNSTESTNVLELSGVISDAGTNGSLVINGPVILDQANSYTGGTTINSSIVEIADPASFGSGPVEVTGDSGIEAINQSMQVNNPFTVDSGSGLNLGTQSPYTLTLAGVISGTGGVTVSGAVEMSGNNTYSNGTGLNAGSGALLVVSNSNALGTGSLDVNQNTTLALSSGIVISNPIVLSDAGSIVGYGSIAPTSPTTYTIENGSMIAGGSGTRPVFNGNEVPVIPGTLSFGSNVSLVFASEGILQFSIENATGTAGTDFSQITTAGTLAIDPTTTTDPFVIQLVGVNSSGMAGTATFNATQSYQWTLLSTAGISGFSGPSQFTIDQEFFQTPIGTGQFYVSQVGNDLDLNFTPVPEPSTWALIGTGLCALGAVAVRRRRRCC